MPEIAEAQALLATWCNHLRALRVLRGFTVKDTKGR
jgi:hypothetical protein